MINDEVVSPDLHQFAKSPDAHGKRKPRFFPDKIVIATPKGKLPLTVGIADTETSRQLGLMDYRKWPAGIHGVLFLFPKEDYISMWMKNTYIPLDMIFIDRKGAIVDIIYNTAPLSEATLAPRYQASAVIEVPAGSTKAWNINIGDKVEYKWFNRILVE